MRWTWRKREPKPQRHCEDTANTHRDRQSSPLEVWVSKELFQKLPIGLDLAINNTIGQEPYSDANIEQLNEQYPIENLPDFVIRKGIEVERRGETEKQSKKYYNFDRALDYVLQLTSWEESIRDKHGELVKNERGEVVKERKYHSNEVGSIMVTLMLAAQHHGKWVGIQDYFLSDTLRKSRNYSINELADADRKKLFRQDSRANYLYFDPMDKLAKTLTKS